MNYTYKKAILLPVPNFKTYYKSMVIQTLWYGDISLLEHCLRIKSFEDNSVCF